MDRRNNTRGLAAAKTKKNGGVAVTNTSPRNALRLKKRTDNIPSHAVGGHIFNVLVASTAKTVRDGYQAAIAGVGYGRVGLVWPG